MSSSTSIWMPLYIKDYLADTQRLSTTEHGAYLLLIMDYWMAGRLDDDDEVLMRITKLKPDMWAKVKPRILPFFILIEGQYTHPRIEEELTKARTNKLEAKVRTSKATAARWNKKRPPLDDA